MDHIYNDYFPTFLYVDKYRFSSKWVYQEIGVPYSMFRYIYSGSARIEIDDESYRVTENDFVYIPFGSRLYCAADEEIVFVSIRFIGNVQLLTHDILKELWHIPRQYHFSEAGAMRDLFEQMYQAAISENNFKWLETRAYMNLICATIAKQVQKQGNKEKTQVQEKLALFDVDSIRRRAMKSHVNTDPRVRILVDYLTLHPEENLSREEMCEMCDVSESTLRRIFKLQTGKTVCDFIKDARMMYASHLLLRTQQSVSEIGYQLGYDSPSYFTKIFREVFGSSPQAYRRKSKEA